jgi:hypothetical protein
MAALGRLFEWRDALVIVKPETASKTVLAHGSATPRAAYVSGIREKELVALTLMISFAVVMNCELGQDPRQSAFAQQDQLGQAFLLHGANPPFREGIQVRTLSREWNPSPAGSHCARSAPSTPGLDAW